MTNTIRTFIAVDLPDELRAKIKNIQMELGSFKLRFVDPGIIHVTMKFLGDVSQDRIDDIKSALDQIKTPCFDVHVHGIGVFPKPNYIRVVWVGLEGGLQELHREIESLLQPLGFPRERKGFKSHATIARVKTLPPAKRTKLNATLSKFSDIDIGSFTVKEVKLKKSTLTPKGPIYEDLYVKELD